MTKRYGLIAAKRDSKPGNVSYSIAPSSIVNFEFDRSPLRWQEPGVRLAGKLSASAHRGACCRRALVCFAAA